ncbi:hypothetical protein Enr13x_72400 [Stieleria neptunia]|uniref:PEP-CTERM protein-sorting domain-containing protein n=1 Tax=Stieleria neptunia TaxID=2527979 RepID=A0A518I2K9_9BACT|nr:hypothetical protein [Stieleria neptunia]QDV47331.1 hypothetical protein Enr13x_72400 [Stieleria neptunia]
MKSFRGAWLNRLIAVPALIVMTLVADRRAEADVIARFDFQGNDYTDDPSNTLGANTGLNLSNNAFVAGTTISDLQFSPNLNPTAALGFGAEAYDDALGFSTDRNDDRSFADTNQAVYFEVDVQIGFRLNLESLSFDSLKTRGTNIDDASVTYSLFVNPAGDPAINGLRGATDFVRNLSHDHYAPGEPQAESTGGSFSTGTWNTGPLDLSDFQGLTGTNTVALRLYGSEGVDQDFGIDNLILSGQVTAIPEPTGTCVLLLGIAASTYRRRRSTAV